MSCASKFLQDDGARRDAISLHDRSLLVEAGAGSGKTAVMAGRIAMMLAEGIAPASIAAVTFTELAASELLSRVREFVGDLSAGKIAAELRVALPDGLSEQRDNLATASAAIDEITCSTIHGFCQRLIKPYPAEADIDPGAGVMDRNQADLTFLEIVEAGCASACPATRAACSPRWCCKPRRNSGAHPQDRRQSAPPPHLVAPPVSPLAGHLTAFRQATADFADFMRKTAATEPETAAIAAHFEEMAERARRRSRSDDACRPRPASDFAAPSRTFAPRPAPSLLSARRANGRGGQAGRPLQGDGERLNDAAEAIMRLLRGLGLAAAGRGEPGSRGA